MDKEELKNSTDKNSDTETGGDHKSSEKDTKDQKVVEDSTEKKKRKNLLKRKR